MKQKSQFAACIIVIGAAISLFYWLWGMQLKSEVGRLGHLKVHENQLIIQYQQQLFWLKDNESLSKQLDFSELGLKVFGDYALFNNGDLLVYHRNQAPSFLSQIAAFVRLTSQAKVNSDQALGDDGFYRCNLLTRQCQVFGENLPKLERTFHLAINQKTNTVFLANTSEHKLYKINEQGKVIASSKASLFRFPNQLKLVNNELWLADTNNHSLKQVEIATEHFGDIIQTVATSIDKKYKFPHQFSHHDNNVWAIVAPKNLAFAQVALFDKQGKLKTKLANGVGEDPMSVTFWQGKLWLADYQDILIEQFNEQGEFLGELQLDTLTELKAERHALIQLAQETEQQGKYAFIVIMIIGFALAFILESKETKAAFKQANKLELEQAITKAKAQYSTPHQGNNIVWLTNRAQKYQGIIYLLLLVMLLLPIISCVQILMSVDEDKWVELVPFFFIIIALEGMLLSMVYNVNYIKRLALGVTGKQLIMQAADKEVRLDISDIKFSDNYFFSDSLSIPVGNAKQRYFDYQQLQTYVLPHINIDNKVSLFSGWKILWQQKEPLFVSTLRLIVLATILALVITVAL